VRIIPAIDIIDGKCVRLTKGDYNTRKIYHDNPLDVAKEFEDNGIRYLHLVDLDGAKSKHIVNHRVLHDIASHTLLQIDFGGGIKSDEDVRIAFENGAAQITGGSIAVQHPELFLQWLLSYGADKIILGADSHHRKIATHGWQQQSETEVVDFVMDYEKKGPVTPYAPIFRKTACSKGPPSISIKRSLPQAASTLSRVVGFRPSMILSLCSK